VKKEALSLDAVKQYKVRVSDETEKIELIKNYIFEIGENVGQTIIFVRTRDSAKMLHKALVDLGYEVTSIHGLLEHDERDKIVKEFKDGLTQVLISTDVLARGFDQQQVLIWFLSLFLFFLHVCLDSFVFSCILPLYCLG
jgi:ATP-dependent RNA helicase DDX19/DBP5